MQLGPAPYSETAEFRRHMAYSAAALPARLLPTSAPLHSRLQSSPQRPSLAPLRAVPATQFPSSRSCRGDGEGRARARTHTHTHVFVFVAGGIALAIGPSESRPSWSGQGFPIPAS